MSSLFCSFFVIKGHRGKKNLRIRWKVRHNLYPPLHFRDDKTKALIDTKSHAQLYLTLWDLVGYSPPGSSVNGIFEARLLEEVAISPSSWESS